jgi:hypothetical protein
MKRHSRFAIIAAAFALTSAVTAHAESDAHLDACIEKFVDAQLAGFPGKITIRKAADSNNYSPLLRARHQIVLSAVDPASGALLATGTCHATKEGLKVSIKAMKHFNTKVAETTKPVTKTLDDAG